MRQTKKPDKIILWLSKEQFLSLDLLPKTLLKQKKRGLDIRLVEGNIGSHKKYYYTLQEFPNDYMITIDDDIFYQSTMIENMFNYSIRYPLSVISQYSVKILWIENNLEPYVLWPAIKNEAKPNLYSFFGTGGGTLFPPFSFAEDVLNKDLFMLLAPTADDVWLNAMCRLKNTKITKISYNSNFLPLLNISGQNLNSINNKLNQNDKQLFAVREYFMKNRGVDPFYRLIK